MELKLGRADIYCTGPTDVKTLSVVPATVGKTQKIVIGDSSGVVHIFSMKKGQLAMAHKGMPTGKAITSVTTGRGVTQQNDERIFYAEGSSVVGCSRKGKEFFRFLTNLADPVRTVRVADEQIWTFSLAKMVNFEQATERNTFLSNERINVGDIIPLYSKMDQNPVLGCQDRTIRILSGNKVNLTTSTCGPVTELAFQAESHDVQNEHSQAGRHELLYGTENGMVGMLYCDSEGIFQGQEVANTLKAGAVNSLWSGIDFTKDGVNDICVAHDDGYMAVLNLTEEGTMVPLLDTRVNETITGVSGGYITNISLMDVVIQTYSGKVISYSQPGAGIVIPMDPRERQRRNITDDQEKQQSYELRLRTLRAEVGELQNKLTEERHRYAGFTENMVATQSIAEVKSRFALDPDTATYALSVELAAPIFCVALRSDIPLDIEEHGNASGIISIGKPDPEIGCATLATCRCQESTHKVIISMKVREGMYGTVHSYVVPANPPKTCESTQHHIVSLCLHTRVPHFEEEPPLNVLTITGSFSLEDIHAWVQACLPESLPGIGTASDVFACYENSLIHTQLRILLAAGTAVLKSDNISTLAILREVVTMKATQTKQRVSASMDASPASMKHAIMLLWPKFQVQRDLMRQMDLLNALQELKMQDDNTDYLDSEYAEILDNEEQVKQKFKDQPKHLSYLIDLVKMLFVHWCRFSGASNAKQRLPILENLLNNKSASPMDVVEFIVGKDIAA